MTTEKKSEIKTEKLCRTCLSETNELHYIFDVLVGSATLDVVVAATTGLKIQKGDGYPGTICCECKEKAIGAYDFKTKSQEAYISLRSILEKEKSNSFIHDKIVCQSISKGVKTENTQTECIPNDDYSDSEFNNASLSRDLNDMDDLPLEAIKNECSSQNGGTLFDCKKCFLSFENQEKFQEHKKKSCIKVELDDSCNAFCPLCGNAYDGTESLSKHLWEYHSEIMGPKKRGRPKKVLTSTILDKLSENGFFITTVPVEKQECTFCKTQINTKDEIRNHLECHKDMKVFCCVLCNKMYLEKKYFDSHICIENKTDVDKMPEENQKDSQENGQEQLNLCTEMLLHDLLEPNFEENYNGIQICSVCTGLFLSESDLIHHHDTDHPELSQRCNNCSKVFASVRSAARHRSVCQEIERHYKCTTCGLKFAFQVSLNKHILRYHEGQSVSVKFMDTKSKDEGNRFQCDTCRRSFHKKELLVKHAKIHMSKYFQCDVCEKKFHRKDNLKSHKRIHDPHRKKAPSNNCLCLYCGRSFSNSSNLIVHMRRHTGEKPYKCDFCDKGFPRSSDLQCHRRSHTGEKPCVCGVCGKGFSRSNKLSRHMRVHTGQRPYKCTYCEKAFSQSNDLTLHIRRHTGDRPYICEICGDRFIQGTALQNHRRTHGHFSNASSEAQETIQTLAFTVPNIEHNH
ncbi:hypothetical protein K1T71_000251 [Dendrolimus kikuchii]|uniref:Uncharacterized protein n=1 Tax=Dendrolimus kikuchii TaxID=765133 RepID=A0ACC1DIM4_9NEOP|nr:hypothetical protein K1T71_000251 [Dendrolimus kikuchii]